MSAFEARKTGIWQMWCERINATASLTEYRAVMADVTKVSQSGNLPAGWETELKYASEDHLQILKEQEQWK